MKNSIQGVLLILGLIMCSVVWPASVDIKGGRYYLYKGDSLISKDNGDPLWFTVDTTAKAGAVNESFRCNCVVTIKQPDITVTTFVADVVEPSSIELTWDRPEHREDGSILLPNEIEGYSIEWSGPGTEVEVLATELSTVLVDVPIGTHVFRIATIDSDGVQGAYSAPISVQVP
tara:strand:+ start:42 stop:563 length:522 start_codon:yes stop_codon:yes gene_type:complete